MDGVVGQLAQHTNSQLRHALLKLHSHSLQLLRDQLLVEGAALLEVSGGLAILEVEVEEGAEPLSRKDEAVEGG